LINIEQYIDTCVIAEICGQGHLVVAIWLLSIVPTLNYRAMNDIPFRYAARSAGHFSILQWLYSMGDKKELFDWFVKEAFFRLHNGYLP
jgi:hypothetical protein